MNSQSNTIPGSSFASQTVAPAVISPSQLMYRLVRRELWEYPSIYIAPLAGAALALFGFLITVGHLPARMRAALALDAVRMHAAIEQPYTLAAVIILGAAFLVGLFYSVEALHGERRDRSIMFWKSLPVSDLTTVLSKASIPLVVLPFISYALTIAVQSIMLLLSTLILIGSGMSATPLWTNLGLFQTSLALFFHLMVVHVLWYAPFYGWLLMVSAWARRAPFLWAVLPVLAIGVLEKLVFNSSHFAGMLLSRVSGGGGMESSSSSSNPMALMPPMHSYLSPGLWIGLALAAGFVAATVRIRRSQGPV